MYNIKKVVFIIIGILAILVGSIGVVLPVIPTTPFLLVASFCFAKGSDKFDKWFKSSKLYKKYLENFIKNKSMTLKEKICILLISDIMISFPIIILDSRYIKIFLIMVNTLKYYYFIFKINTEKSYKVY